MGRSAHVADRSTILQRDTAPAVALTRRRPRRRDTAPPLTNQQDAFQVGYDPTYVDPRGRTFYAAVRYAFK